MFNMYKIDFYKVLAFNEKGDQILSSSKTRPVISKADADKLSFTDQLILSQMIDASNLYNLSIKAEINQDFTRKISKF